MSDVQSQSLPSSYPFLKKKKTFFQEMVFPILFEIILPLGLITLLSYVFDEGNRFIHPFWLVLLPISAYYGLKKGLICAVVASLFLLIGNVPPQQLNEDLYTYFFKFAREPILWFLAAFVLGELRERQTQEIQELRQAFLQTEEDKKILEQAFQNQKKIKEALEVRIAAELRTPSTSLRVVRHLIQRTPDQVLTHFITAIEELIAPDQFSIYVVEKAGLTLTYNHHWPEGAPYDTFIPAGSPLFDRIVKNKRDVCIINADEEAILGNAGVLALPLIDSSRNEVFGMVKFEHLSFRDLNLSNVETIRELCKCVCQAYVMALDVMKAKTHDADTYSS